MSKHFDQYSQTYILMKNNMFIAYMDIKSQSYIHNMDDEYYYHGVKLLAMAVKGSERRKGIGTDLLKTICMQSDCSGCSVELVANGFDVKIEDDDDPRRRIDAINEGIGFRDLRFTDKEQRESRRLRRWYKRFGFREAVPPPNASFQNDYFKRACLLRIPDSACEGYKEVMESYCV